MAPRDRDVRRDHAPAQVSGARAAVSIAPLEATFGGAESNVAVSLAQFGCDASFVTVLPANPVGDAAVGQLRQLGVDTRFIRRGGDRVGIYFLETGAAQRASRGRLRSRRIVDRRRGGERLRLGGDFLRRDLVPHHRNHAGDQRHRGRARARSGEPGARDRASTVSCDYNYRKNLWKYGRKRAGGDARAGRARSGGHRQRRGLPARSRHRLVGRCDHGRARSRVVPRAGRTGAGGVSRISTGRSSPCAKARARTTTAGRRACTIAASSP